jgi:hypothetical protein
MAFHRIRDKREALARRSSAPAARAKMLAIDIGRGQHVGDGFRTGLPVRLVEALEFHVRCCARHREHCATGVSFGSTPEKSGCVQIAGKLMPPS